MSVRWYDTKSTSHCKPKILLSLSEYKFHPGQYHGDGWKTSQHAIVIQGFTVQLMLLHVSIAKVPSVPPACKAMSYRAFKLVLALQKDRIVSRYLKGKLFLTVLDCLIHEPAGKAARHHAPAAGAA